MAIDYADVLHRVARDIDRPFPEGMPGSAMSLREAAADLRARAAEVADLKHEVKSVLAQLDELAETWGDEGQFRRCRDRLRAAVGEHAAKEGGGD